jgi:hypothetical protein
LRLQQPFKVMIKLNYLFCLFNHKILHKTYMKMCGRNFNHFEHINRKILVFKGEKKKHIFTNLARKKSNFVENLLRWVEKNHQNGRRWFGECVDRFM